MELEWSWEIQMLKHPLGAPENFLFRLPGESETNYNYTKEEGHRESRTDATRHRMKLAIKSTGQQERW
jgi:hypothetical protein